MQSLTMAIGAVVVLAGSTLAQGMHWRRPTVGMQGYRRGHWATNPNGTRLDNWSTRGNTNPVTGMRGYKPVYPTMPSYRQQMWR